MAEDPEDPPEETWNLTSTESMVEISLTKNEAVSDAGTWVLDGLVEEVSWEAWTSCQGNTKCLNINRQPVQNQQVTWHISGAPGFLTLTGGTTDAQGRVTNSLFLAPTPRPGGTIYLSCQFNSYELASASYDVAGADVPDSGETWTHSTSMIPWLELDLPSQISLPPGAEASLDFRVLGNLWQHSVSSLGNTQSLLMDSSQPVAWAGVQASLVEGDGQLSVGSGVTDSMGGFSTTFTMGASSSRVHVWVDAGPDAPPLETEVLFQPSQVEEVYSLDHSYQVLSVHSLDAQPSTEEGAVTLVAGIHVAQVDVYVSNLGNVDARPHPSMPAPPGVEVAFSVVDGQGVDLSSSGQAAITDTDGRASILCHLSQLSTPTATVRAIVGVGQPGGERSRDIILQLPEEPEVWQYVRTEGTLQVSLSTQGPGSGLHAGNQVQLNADVRYHSWEWWESNRGGGAVRNASVSAAQGASLTFHVEQGDGSISPGQTGTDSTGRGQAIFTSGMEHSLVSVHAAFGGAEALASASFPVSTAPVWIFSHTEDVALGVELEDLGSREVEATVSISQEDVYFLQTDPDQTQRRNFRTGPAIGAEVSFSLDVGSMDPAQRVADVNGVASSTHSRFRHGQSGTLTAIASFSGLSATASLTVHGDDQVDDSEDDQMEDGGEDQMEDGSEDQMEDEEEDQVDDQAMDQTLDQTEVDDDQADQMEDQTEDEGEDQTPPGQWVANSQTITVNITNPIFTQTQTVQTTFSWEEWKEGGKIKKFRRFKWGKPTVPSGWIIGSAVGALAQGGISVGAGVGLVGSWSQGSLPNQVSGVYLNGEPQELYWHEENPLPEATFVMGAYVETFQFLIPNSVMVASVDGPVYFYKSID